MVVSQEFLWIWNFRPFLLFSKTTASTEQRYSKHQVFFFRNTNPQPQRPPKQPNYQDFLAVRCIFGERKTWQKTCIKKCVIEFLYSSDF